MTSGDFDIHSLAKYLHLTPAQVSRMADRNRLPGRKIGGEWRFHEAEIHHWLEEQIGVSDDDELVRVEGVLDRSGPEEKDVCIAKLLAVEAIAVPLVANTRTSVITRMVDLAAGTGWLWEPDKFADAVRARENLHSTALDNGMALLHPRRPQSNMLAKPFLAFGRTARGIPFGDARGSLTDLFFLILSTDDRGHLRTLARLSRLIADPEMLSTMRTVQDAAELHRALSAREVEMFG